MTGVNLSLAPGEALALCGPSGAGKTSLLRAMAGDISPAGGQVMFQGQDPAHLARRKRTGIAMISQHHDLIGALRVDRNVMAGALGRWGHLRALRYLMWSTPDEYAQAETALGLVGLSGKAKRKTATLSGGERQRVAIARCLIQAPRLLLADEPVASLDQETATHILELLTRTARQRGMALVCSIHQPDMAARFFPRIAHLQNGTLQEQR